MYFRVIAYVLAVSCCLAATPALSQRIPDEIAALSKADQQEFRRIEDAISHSTGNDESYEPIRASIEQFLASHPNFIPMEVEAARLKWRRVSDGLGSEHGSRSLLPVFLEYQKMAPAYGKTYRLSARAYMETFDYEGARMSLEKATALDPDEPRVDINWSVLHERQQDRAGAIASARMALSKAGGDAEVIVDAVVLIATNQGIRNAEDIDDVARTIIAHQDQGATLTEVTLGLLDRYNYQPGLINVVDAVLRHLAAEQAKPSAELNYQRALMYVVGGTKYWNDGARGIDPRYMQAAKETLVGLKNVPDVAERVWALQFDIAMSENDFAEGDRLIGLGKRAGYSEKLVGGKEATLRYGRGEIREALVMFDQLKLPKTGLYWTAMERVGDLTVVREYRLRQALENPTNAYALGEYAGFMLYRFKDFEAAIDFGERAMAISSYPVLQHTLSSAYLLASGTRLRSGQLDQALAWFEKAKELGFDEKYLMQSCMDFCGEVEASLRAFR
jgi:tetratricopeptide (TPR) repeat protein